MAFLFISHDKAVINYMCDRQLYMQEGRITDKKTPNAMRWVFYFNKNISTASPAVQPLSQYFLQPFDTDRLAQMLVHPGIERHLDI